MDKGLKVIFGVATSGILACSWYVPHGIYISPLGGRRSAAATLAVLFGRITDPNQGFHIRCHDNSNLPIPASSLSILVPTPCNTKIEPQAMVLSTITRQGHGGGRIETSLCA